ncbi:5'-adenylylsulfate reductase-like 5 [Rhynchospora pubera]|uniref:5'-adenylylsulfate reductase-like 5 n=1 Tax=Rhynchospora pubera TaxID=906938 RepID=A0AAV8BR39_9POAL|nr:5'-adenylylsulfate reductase-like 5 [Rhynchospora pubera]
MAWLRCLIAFLFCISAASAVESSAESSPVCPVLGPTFVDSLRAQCPLWIDLTLPMEVDGKSLYTLVEGIRASRSGSFYSILFYAKWCPFSSKFRPMFDTLSYMFPQVMHLALEESTATSSLFTRLGIHSVPSLVLLNGTSLNRFTDTKDISSLVAFYRKNTGFEPVAFFDVQPRDDTFTPIWLQDIPLKEKIAADPYLALSMLFVLLKVVLWILPLVWPHLRAFWVVYAQGIKLKVVAGMHHILERAAHVLDVKRLWNKLKHFNKKRNLRSGAKSARVWASSLASSVALGDSPSSSRYAT